MYAKVNGQQLVQYPYTMEDLRAEYPNTTFPAGMADEQLAEFGLVRVVMNAPAEHNPFTQSAEQGPPFYSVERGRWEHQWTIRPATPAEIAARKQSLQDDIVYQTQKRLDGFARTRGYDGILSACTYATSSVPKFQAEGQYCVEARDATWAKLYEMLAEVTTGTRPVPTGYADVEPELPVLEWPNA